MSRLTYCSRTRAAAPPNHFFTPAASLRRGGERKTLTLLHPLPCVHFRTNNTAVVLLYARDSEEPRAKRERENKGQGGHGNLLAVPVRETRTSPDGERRGCAVLFEGTHRTRVHRVCQEKKGKPLHSNVGAREGERERRRRGSGKLVEHERTRHRGVCLGRGRGNTKEWWNRRRAKNHKNAAQHASNRFSTHTHTLSRGWSGAGKKPPEQTHAQRAKNERRRSTQPSSWTQGQPVKHEEGKRKRRRRENN